MAEVVVSIMVCCRVAKYSEKRWCPRSSPALLDCPTPVLTCSRTDTGCSCAASPSAARTSSSVTSGARPPMNTWRKRPAAGAAKEAEREHGPPRCKTTSFSRTVPRFTHTG